MGHVIISSHPWTMGLENITRIKKILIISAYVLLVTNWDSTTAALFYELNVYVLDVYLTALHL